MADGCWRQAAEEKSAPEESWIIVSGLLGTTCRALLPRFGEGSFSVGPVGAFNRESGKMD
jgi:hypothetical protein